jgi:hypothetical protein
MTAPVQKNKGGRPSNAELAARGMTKTELDAGLKILKRYFGKAVDRIVELASDEKMPIDKQFKMNQDVVNMFMAMLKAEAMLKQAAAREDGDGMNTDTEDKPQGVVFDF